MKKLPVGIQTFRQIIEEDYIYVDKTEDIYNLLTDNAKYFFLSRPRRFGKSLLINTLEEIFSGNKELFKNFYIYNKIAWDKYPIIKFDFSVMDLMSPERLERSILLKIEDISKEYNIQLDKENGYKYNFAFLIKELSKINKVVILIDEYDKPIIDYIDNLEVASQMKDILKNFYVTIKSSDQYIKFTLLTGVSKFTKISVFSGLNNLTDITLNSSFSTLLGYTEDELNNYFFEHIKLTAKKLEQTEDSLKNTLKTWYNGYSWDGTNFVYNPFSILNALSLHQIDNYWFQSGTPTFLIKLIKEKNIDVKSLESFHATKDLLDSFEIEDIEVETLLFQTGYLTVKKIIEPNSPFREYVLTYPNVEVEESLLTNILMNFSNSRKNNQIKIGLLVKPLNNNDLDSFFDIIFNIFTNIPHQIFMSDRESYYHTIIYLILTLIGVRIKSEVQTNKGSIDSIIETHSHIYIFEFKMSNTNQALKQIENKKYYESYLLSPKKKLLIGVSFDSDNRNIKDWKVKEIKKE